MLSFFYIWILLIFSGNAKKHYSNLNKTIYLEENQIAFFESFDFPLKACRCEECPFDTSCNLNVSLINANSQQNLIMNVIWLEVDLYKSQFIVTNDSFSYETIYTDGIHAIQGFAYSEEINGGCPFESFAKEQPFEISDETEIIYLRSKYDENVFRAQPCLWKFSATIQYGFKIVVDSFNISAVTAFRVRNSTHSFIGNDILELKFPYYNEDNFIEISLSSEDFNSHLTVEFQAYISIVKKQFQFSDAHCSISVYTDPITTIWENNYFGGYQKNVKCSYGTTISPNHALWISILSFVVEINVDYIRYDIDGQNITFMTDEDIFFAIEGYSDINKTKNVWFEFVSDGSFQLPGIQLGFQDMECKCPLNFAACHNFSSNLPIFKYCGILHCKINFEAFPDEEDIFLFKSNNETVLEINKYNYLLGDFEIYVPSLSVTTMEIFTSTSRKQRQFKVLFSTIKKPLEDNIIILTDDNPNYIIDSTKFEMAPVSLSESLISKNISFVIYAISDYMYVIGVQIYNDKNLTINYSQNNYDCFSVASYNKCILHKNQFVALFDNTQRNTVSLAVRISKHIKGCVFEETFFVLDMKKKGLSVAALANSEGNCRIVLFGCYGCFMNHLWTTAEDQNIKIYFGKDTSMLFFEFNSKTMKNWGVIGMFADYYTIIVPHNSALFMTLDISYIYPNIIPQIPFNSIVATPFLGNTVSKLVPFKDSNFIVRPYPDTARDNFLAIILKSFCAKLTFLYYKKSPDDQFYFYVNEVLQNVTLEIGSSIVFCNEQLDFYYYRKTPFCRYCGLVFYVEIIET